MKPALIVPVLRRRLPSPLEVMGANLVGWWNADSASKITTTGSGVSSWLDEIGAYDLVQGTDAARPVWSATSFNGRGGVTFDGTDDFLRKATVPASWPDALEAGEMWICCDQQTPDATATQVFQFVYGSTASTGNRGLSRVQTGGVGRSRTSFHNIASAGPASPVYLGRHYVRSSFDGSNCTTYTDGTAGAAAAIASGSTTTTQVTMGATNLASPGSFAAVNVHQVIVLDTTPTAAQVTALNAYFAARL